MHYYIGVWRHCVNIIISVSICIITAGFIPVEESRAKWIFDKTINLHRRGGEGGGGGQSRITQEQNTTAPLL